MVCHRLANSDRTIKKVLNRKHAEQIINNKSKLKGMKFLDVLNIGETLNTSNNLDEKTSVNSSQNRHRIYINYSLCPYNWFLHDKVKEMMQEGLIHNFAISNGGIIKIRESASLAQFPVIHENALFWNIDFYYKFNFRIFLIIFSFNSHGLFF